MASPSPYLLDSPSPSPQIVPGAWPDKSLTRPPTPESPQHLDQVLSFHKRLSVSFSSPIMMPTRSPLLGMSASASSIGAVAVGSQHEPSMSLAALADESFSSVDSTQEAVSPTRTDCFSSRPSEDTSLSSAPSDSQNAYYSSPAVDRHRKVFTAPPKPASTSHGARRQLPPRLDIAQPDLNGNEIPNISISSTDSAINTPSTTSPTTPASPGPIVFASPPSSTSQFPIQFPSTELLATSTLEEVPIVSSSNPPQSSFLPGMHTRTNALPVLLGQLRTDSESTVQTAWTSDSDRDQLPLSSGGVRPRKPWREFARENSREPSSLTRDHGDSRDHYNSASYQASSASSRRVLHSIQTTAPPSRSHTLALPLMHPTHKRTMSSGSQLAPNDTNIRPNSSNSRSSPHLTSRPSFPSRPPSPTRASRPSKRPRTRSNSLSLFRRVSNRSKTRFSRSDYTGDVSIAAADYAAAQCDTFVSEVNTVDAHDSSSIVILTQQPSTAEEPREATNQVAVTITAGGKEEKSRLSVLGKLKKFGDKFRAVVRGSSASRRGGMQVRVDVKNSQETNMVPSAGANLRTTSRPRNRLKSPRPRPRSMLPRFSSPNSREPTSSSPQPTLHNHQGDSDHSSAPHQPLPRPEDILPVPNAGPKEMESSTSEQPQTVFANLSMPGYPFLGSVSPPIPSIASPSVPFSPRPQASKSGSRARIASTMRGAVLTASRRLSVPSFGASDESSSIPKRRNSVNSPMLLSYFAVPGNPFMGVVPPPSPSAASVTPARPTRAYRGAANNSSPSSPSRRPMSWAVSSPSEVSPTLTVPVEGKARARDKNEEIELTTISPVIEETVTASGSAIPAPRASDVAQTSTDASSRNPVRRPSTRFPFNRMSSFWGWEGPHTMLI